MTAATTDLTAQWLHQASALLALSRLFTEGGEGLSRTLGSLAEASEYLAECAGDKETIEACNILRSCSKLAGGALAPLEYEFNRLFIGPTPPVAPPYESCYLSPDHLVMQDQTIAVRKMYQSKGLEFVDQGSTPDDFIATELEFAAYLLTDMVQMYQAGNTADAQQSLNFYRDFWDNHPGLWLQRFAEDINQAARIPVFFAVAQLLHVIVSIHNAEKGGGLI